MLGATDCFFFDIHATSVFKCNCLSIYFVVIVRISRNVIVSCINYYSKTISMSLGLLL